MLVQVAGSLLSLLGFGIIVTHFVAYGSEHFRGLHQFLGLILMILTIIQPIIGYLAHRVFVATGGTSHYHTAHRWIGRTLLPFAFIVICFGLSLYMSDFFEESDYIRIDFAWLCLIGIIVSSVIVVGVYENYPRPANQTVPAKESELENMVEEEERGEPIGREVTSTSSIFGPIQKHWPVWSQQIIFVGYVSVTMFCIVPLLSSILM